MLAPDGSDDEDSAYRVRDSGLISGSGRSPGEGNGYPLKYFLPVEFHGQRSLMSYRPWGHKETNITEWLTLSFHGVQRGAIPFLPISLKLQDWDIAWPKFTARWPLFCFSIVITSSFLSYFFCSSHTWEVDFTGTFIHMPASGPLYCLLCLNFFLMYSYIVP